MARIGIIGSAGRMGQALAEAVAAAGEALSGGCLVQIGTMAGSGAQNSLSPVVAKLIRSGSTA